MMMTDGGSVDVEELKKTEQERKSHKPVLLLRLCAFFIFLEKERHEINQRGETEVF